MKRIWLYSLVAAAVTVSQLIYPTVSYASKLTAAQQKENQLQQQQKDTKSKISQLTNQEQSINAQIAGIQAKIQSLDNSIVHTQVDIAKRNNQIAQLKQEIAQTQKQIDSQYAVLERRVRVMYEDGHATYLEVLMSATSFSDLLSRLQLLEAIAAGDKQVLTQIQASKKHLDTASHQVEQQLVAVKQSYNLLEKQKSEEKDQQRAEQVLLAKVHNTKLSEEANLKSENSAMKGLKSLISQLQAQEGQYTGASDGWTWPVPGHTSVSSGYGWRTWPDGSREFHNGLDIPAPVGAEMVAATGGKVLYAGPATGFGDWIVIESAGGLLEIYGHMYAYEIKVYPGEVVSKGQQIASVGNNGNSTGPHLHFTVASGFDSSGFPISVNPTKYIG